MDHDCTGDMRRIVQHIHAYVVIHNILILHPELHSDYDSDISSDESDSNNDVDDEEVEGHGVDHPDNDIEEDGQVYIDYPWREFERAAEQTRFEKHQRILGQRKRERLRVQME